MRRALGILFALLPFAFAWSGFLLAATGLAGISERIAAVGFLHVLAWCGLAFGGFIAMLNAFLSFGRRLILQFRGIPPEEQRHVSGFPMLGSLVLMLSAIPFFPQVWPSIVVTVLLLLDTGGPLWFLISTWHDVSLWTGEGVARTDDPTQ
jgi:hypothetical protein